MPTETVNDHKADVILRSSDNIDFRTFKLLLSLASPVFEDMFGLPQPGPDTNSSEMNDGLPVIAISEQGRTLGMLLKLIHPKCSLLLDDIDDIDKVLEMSKKYDMERVAERTRDMAKRILLQMEENHPVRAYAIASRLQLDDEASRAARSTLRLPILEICQMQVTELKYIAGTQLQKLYNYHYQCGKTASALASTSTWIPSYNDAPAVWFNQNYHSAKCESILVIGGNRYQRTWWVEYMRESGVALASQPHGSTVKKPELVNTALRKATACEICRRRVFEELPRFLETYAAEVERVLSEVKDDTSETAAVILIQHGSA